MNAVLKCIENEDRERERFNARLRTITSKEILAEIRRYRKYLQQKHHAGRTKGRMSPTMTGRTYFRPDNEYQLLNAELTRYGVPG